MSAGWTPVGAVGGIVRYPLKGTGGEHVTRARLGWHGVTADRRFGLLRVDDLSGLPWASPRQFPQLVSWRSCIPSETGDLRVTLPDGRVFDVPERDAAARGRLGRAASAALGEEVRPVSLWSGAHDSMTVSLITTNTIMSSSRLVNESMLAVDRFRPNIVIETDNPDPWPERKWVGRELRIGEGADAAVVRVDRHTTRCEVVDLEPGTGIATHELFTALRTENRNRAGVYGTPVHVGTVTVCDLVSIR